jgi:zinc-binding alcohol dehydrogenase/oxidoreductase
VTYGATTGATREFLVRRIFWKQLDVLGSTMCSPDDVRAMLALFGPGSLRSVVDTVFALAEAGVALRQMAEAARLGKIMLRIA